MARKRMIDPSLWTDPKVIQLDTKLVMAFVGIITHADDEGIIELDPASLYFKLARTDIPLAEFPAIIKKLDEVGLLKSYGQYGFLPNWYKHQNLKGRRPQLTKLVRPPKAFLVESPKYVDEWEETFSTKDTAASYPYDTCYTTSESPVVTPETDKKPSDITSETPVAHELHTRDSQVNHECATGCTPVALNRSEVNRKEKNRSEKNIVRESGDSPSPKKRGAAASEETELYHSVQQAFLSRNGDRFTSWPKEGKAIKDIIRKATIRAPDDPEGLIRQMMNRFWDLKSSTDKFWSSQPFLPSALNASGIWDRVLETFREDPGEHEMSEEEWEELIREDVV